MPPKQQKVISNKEVAREYTKQATWFSTVPSKRWGELFYLWYSPVWISIFATVVITEWYKSYGDVEFFILGLLVSLPCVIVPILFPGEADKGKPLSQRYWVKANLWIAIFGFIGNYFWTHYFFVLLKATYKFPVTIMLNKVPVFLYFVTHARFKASFAPGAGRIVATAILVFGLSYFTAFMEAWTMEKVPYYAIEDRTQMYLVGSSFYCLYFVVSFPMFLRVDETPGAGWNLSRTAIESLASAMIVFCLCDFWRLIVGGIKVQGVESDKVPFVY